MLCAELLIDDRDMLSDSIESKTPSEIAAVIGADESLVMLKAVSMAERGYEINGRFSVSPDYLKKS